MKTEDKYIAFEALGAELGIPVPQTYLTLESRTPEGMIYQSYHDRSHSWVRNFYNLLFCFYANTNPSGSGYAAGSLLFGNTSGTPIYAGLPFTVSFIGSGYTGIIIGSANTTETFGSYGLADMIWNGAAFGQMLYSDMPSPEITYTTNVWSLVLRRVFTNPVTTPTLDILEIGLVTGWGGNPANVMMCRDVLFAPVSVIPGGILTVTYTISLVYPG